MTVALNDLPERPISAHPNFVTPEGLRQIEVQLALAQRELGEARGDREGLARLRRDVDYWTTRRATAQVVPDSADRTEVRFGSAAVLEAADGERRTVRIVGEDEANPDAGAIPYVSPLAQALLRRRVGETVEVEDRAWRILEVG